MPGRRKSNRNRYVAVRLNELEYMLLSKLAELLKKKPSGIIRFALWELYEQTDEITGYMWNRKDKGEN